MTSTSITKLQELCSAVECIRGDFAEIGVSQGATFKHLVRLAQAQNKTAHAYDSFLGMNDPSDKDLGQYPKGKFSVGGEDSFINKMGNIGINKNKFKTFAGYIPFCFDKADDNQIYSFIFLDVDHYEATKIALSWCDKRLTSGAILLLDDYFPNKKGLASLAIDEWLLNNHNYNIIGQSDKQLTLKRV